MPTGVLVLGDAHLDVGVRPGGAIIGGSDVPAEVALSPGGQGANLAVRLARRGVPTRLVCALGDDVPGDLVRASLAREGIALVDARAASTGAVVVLVSPHGERTMLSDRSPLLRSVSGLDAGDARWVIVSGYLLLEAEASALGSVAWLPERRCVVGCAITDDRLDAWRAALRALRPALLVLNRAEAAAVSGAEGGRDQLARRLAAELGAVAVVTEPTGADASLGGRQVAVVTDPVAAIDTTGAGDAFAAALLAELYEGPWPPDEEAFRDALAAGAALASRVAGVAGAQGRVAGEDAGRLPP